MNELKYNLKEKTTRLVRGSAGKVVTAKPVCPSGSISREERASSWEFFSDLPHINCSCTHTCLVLNE